MPVAWLGAGLIATPMIERLLAAGHPVAVWNRTRAKIAPLLERGATELARPADAAPAAGLVAVCLLDGDAVEATIFDHEHGLVAGMATAATRARARVLVDHSSIDPARTRDLAARLADGTGIRWVDAPVSGGVAGARAGTLTVMCGGDPAALAEAEPALRAYAGRITWMGPTGAGQTTKLVNQAIVGSALATLAEAVAFAQAAGIDCSRLTTALSGGWADSRPMRVFVPRMVDGYDQPLGALSTMLKDLDTAAELARRLDAPLPMTTTAQQLMRMMAARGEGDEDPAALIRLHRRPPPPPG